MWLKLSILFCAILLIGNAQSFVRRDAPAPTLSPNILESLQKNMDQFRQCLDQTLAKTVGAVNENQLKPVFGVIGDSVNRLTKAFEDLTGITKKPDLDFDI